MAISGLKLGNTTTWTNGTGSAVVSGEPVAVGNDQLGIASQDAATSAEISVHLKGVVTVAKAAVAIAQGDPVFVVIGAGLATAATNVATNTLYFLGRAHTAAGSGDATVAVDMRTFSDEPSREITLAATGNQILNKASFLNGKALRVRVPNTAGLSVTFPLMSTVPLGVTTTIQKTSADAAAITVAANASDTLVGTVGTVDAANDRVTLYTATGGPVTQHASIIA